MLNRLVVKPFSVGIDIARYQRKRSLEISTESRSICWPHSLSERQTRLLRTDMMSRLLCGSLSVSVEAEKSPALRAIDVILNQMEGNHRGVSESNYPQL